MSSKILQLSPQVSTSVIRKRITAQDPCSAPSTSSLDLGFLRSWFEYDSDLDEGSRGINWGAISGLALSIAISASCWAGVVWIVARVWK